MARKRAPGGGRKPQGRFSGLAGTPVNLRMPIDLRDRLDAVRAESGRSLTQEVLERLTESLERDQRAKHHPAAIGLSNVLATIITIVSVSVTMRWRENPFAWRTVKLAFDKVMDRYAPAGEIKKPHGADENTPEEAAAVIANIVRLQLETVGGTALSDLKLSGMVEAARNLSIKPKGE
jgi:hypothetical protein